MAKLTVAQKSAIATIAEGIESEYRGSIQFDEFAILVVERYLEGRKKEKKANVDCYPEFVEAWTKAYPDLGFDAQSGKKIKSLIIKTRDHARARLGKEPDDKDVIGMFQYVLAYIKRENHWCHGKDISTLDAKYLSIILEIRNGKQQTSKKQSIYQWADNI